MKVTKDAARRDFDMFFQLYERIHLIWRRHSGEGREHILREAIPLCEQAISLSRTWVQKYKPEIQALSPTTEEAYKWMPMLEEIRNHLQGFRILLSYRQTDSSLLETADQIREDVENLLKTHIYLP